MWRRQLTSMAEWDRVSRGATPSAGPEIDRKSWSGVGWQWGNWGLHRMTYLALADATGGRLPG
ncbi:hypothetical protein GCM10010222_17160 [Streptomyces tanashiensis]|nr:hypothetical protein GCM10010222_17160 [Streptomyces tanashiensis]